LVAAIFALLEEQGQERWEALMRVGYSVPLLPPTTSLRELESVLP
jgi:hypothetical protein